MAKLTENVRLCKQCGLPRKNNHHYDTNQTPKKLKCNFEKDCKFNEMKKTYYRLMGTSMK